MMGENLELKFSYQDLLGLLLYIHSLSRSIYICRGHRFLCVITLKAALTSWLQCSLTFLPSSSDVMQLACGLNGQSGHAWAGKTGVGKNYELTAQSSFCSPTGIAWPVPLLFGIAQSGWTWPKMICFVHTALSLSLSDHTHCDIQL